MLLIILIILFGIGAIYGARMAKAGSVFGKPLLVGCALITVILAIASLVFSGRSSDDKFIKASKHYNYLIGEKMGRFLAEHHVGKKVLVLQPPALDPNGPSPSDAKLAEGLRDGLDGNMLRLDFVALDMPKKLDPSVQEMMKVNPQLAAEQSGEFPKFEAMNYRAWFNLLAFEKFLQTRKDDYDIIIIAMDLPLDYSQSRVLRGKGAPKLALLNASTYSIWRSFAKEMVIAAITYRPNTEAWRNQGESPGIDEEEFERRFLFITPDNIAETIKTYPKYFKR